MVSNTAGIVTSNAATLTVAPLVLPPVITVQPVPQYVSPGANLVLTVAATGTGLQYQWKKDGVALDGAVSPTLTLNNAAAATMGFYSATVTGDSGVTNSGAAIVTVNLGGTSRLINVATRGYVSAGAALTPGFVLQGTGNKPLVIRAIGPTLSAFNVTGALADPLLEVIPLGGSTAIATNDNWGGMAALQAGITQAGAFLLSPGSKDAAVIVRLPPGGYSVVVSGVGNTTGTALVEVYDLEP